MRGKAEIEYHKASDTELLAAIARGSVQAFSVLYDRLSPRLYGLALKIVQDQAIAEDILQDIFMTIWKKAAQFDHRRGHPMAWLMVLCRNRSIDRLRVIDKRRERTAPLDEQGLQQIAAESDPNPFEMATYRETQDVVRKALGELPEEQRSLIEFAYFKGYSQSEIALELGIPLGTVKTRIRLGMEKLRNILKTQIVR